MRTYLRLLGYIRPYSFRMTGAVVCMLLFAFTTVFSIGMLLPFLNVLFGDTSPGLAPAGPAEIEALEQSLPDKLTGWRDDVKLWLMGFFLRASPIDSLARVCIGVFIFTFLKGVFSYGQRFLIISVEQAVIRDLRNDLYKHIHQLSLSFFHGRKTGQILSRITYDVTLVRQAVSAVFTNLVRDALLVAFYLGVLLWISWRLALVSFVVLPPMMYVIARVSRKLRKHSAASQQRMADITSVLQETVSGIRIVKAFAMERSEIRRFSGRTHAYYRSLVRLQRVGSLATPLTEFLAVVGALIVLWYGGLQVLGGKGGLAPDWFVIFVASMVSAMSPIKKLTQVNAQLQEGVVAARRVFDLLDTKPEITDAVGAASLSGMREGLEFHDVSFGYEPDRPVLRNINLRVNQGDVVAIVGPSGAGKSTLVDLVPRFYDPVSGRITVDGQDLRSVTLQSLRRLMGIVTQETILFNDTLWNNIAYGMDDPEDDAVVRAARAANAHDFIQAFPEGYGTVIGDRGVKLSGGERQRIAIARAILKNPPILILDEATSSLDSESEYLVQEALDRLMTSRTTLVIAHRLSTIQNADRIVVLDGGRLVSVGDHEMLMSKPGVYRRLYETQFLKGRNSARGETQVAEDV